MVFIYTLTTYVIVSFLEFHISVGDVQMVSV